MGKILPTQTRLAQIVEMLHVSVLLHDDVLDDSPLRHGAPWSQGIRARRGLSPGLRVCDAELAG